MKTNETDLPALAVLPVIRTRRSPGRWRATAVGVAMALALGAGPAWADVPEAVWQALKEREVVIQREDGAPVQGKLIGVDRASVVVMLDTGEPVAVARSKVTTVRGREASEKRSSSETATPAPPSGAPEGAAPATPDAPESKPDDADQGAQALVGKRVMVTRKDGSQVIGELSSVDGQQVVVLTPRGAPYVLPRSELRSLRAAKPGEKPKGADATEETASAPAGPSPTGPGYVRVKIDSNDPNVQLTRGDDVICSAPCDVDVARVGPPLRLRQGGAGLGPSFSLDRESGTVVLTATVTRPPRLGAKIGGGVMLGVGAFAIVGGLAGAIGASSTDFSGADTLTTVYGTLAGIGAALLIAGGITLSYGLGDYDVSVPGTSSRGARYTLMAGPFSTRSGLVWSF
jgi:small nuclear ribonucleoprotein (snRNP)-like protein